MSMTFDEALKLLKNHYNWRVVVKGSDPDGSKFVFIAEDGQLQRISEKQILTMAADIHQEDLFGGSE